MHRRYAGVGFIMIAAFLYTSRYILVALYIKEGVFPEIFYLRFAKIAPELTSAAFVSLLAGVGYIIWGEGEELLKRMGRGTAADKNQ